MGLAISRRVGETFWVGDDWYQVAEIMPKSGFVLLDRKGGSLTVAAETSLPVGHEAQLRDGYRNQNDAVRVVVDAPLSTLIWRGEVREDSAIVDLTQTEAALLAPVPYEHLESALDTCVVKGKVAFGSGAWEVFRDLDQQFGGRKVPVLIYASSDRAPFPPKATWTASYIGHVESRRGQHPDKMEFRPASTLNYTADNLGHWAIFWEVEGLRHLGAKGGVPVGGLVGLHTNKSYEPEFRPRGPVLIENPFIS